MRWRLAVVPLLVVLVTCLSSCGGTSEQDYCEALKKDRTEISDIQAAANPGAALVSGLSMLEGIADQAPSDLTDEWQTFLNAIEGLRDALKSAGVKASDFHDGKVPPGLSADQLARIAQTATVIGSTSTVDAANGIEQQARDVCKLDLGLA